MSFLSKIKLPGTDFLKKNFSYIAKSLYNGAGKISSSRISSYYILAGILVLCLVFAAIELGNAIYTWKHSGTYVVPAAHITIFGMILAHHLILLGLKKSSDSDIIKYNGSNNSLTTSNTVQQPANQNPQILNNQNGGDQQM